MFKSRIKRDKKDYYCRHWQNLCIRYGKILAEDREVAMLGLGRTTEFGIFYEEKRDKG